MLTKQTTKTARFRPAALATVGAMIMTVLGTGSVAQSSTRPEDPQSHGGSAVGAGRGPSDPGEAQGRGQAPSDPGEADVDSLTLKDCKEQFGVFTIPDSQAEPYLPEGFELTGLGDPLPEGRAVVAVLITECDGEGEGGTGDHLFASLVVKPAEQYGNPDALFHYIHVAGATTSQTIADAYAAWGVPRMPVVEELELDAPTDEAISSWEGAVSEGEDGVQLSSTVAGPHPEGCGDCEVRQFGVEVDEVNGAEVTGIIDISATEAWAGGAGYATLTNDGLIPFEVDGPGFGYHAWDFGEVFTPAPLPSASPESFTIEDNTEQFGAFTIPASQAEPYLPEGFRLAGFGDSLPEGRAALGVLISEGEGPRGGEATTMLWNVLVVEPPEEYKGDADLHYIQVVGVTTSSTVADVYTEWGVPMVEGEIDLDANDELLSSWTGEVRHGEDSIQLDTTVAGSHPDDLANGAFRVFGVSNGEVTGGVDVSGTDPWAGGAGYATLVNDGLIPFDVDGPGASYHAWDFGAKFQRAEF